MKTLAPALDLQQGADRTQRRRARACASSCAAARCARVRCALARTPGRGRERHASFALPRACGKRQAQTVLDPRRTVPLVKRRSHAPSLRAGRASYGMSLAPMLLSLPRSTQSTWDDLGSGMMLAYMLAHLQVAAAQLTEHTSSTTSALLLAALSWLMSLALRACTVGLPFFPVCETEGGSCSTQKNPPSARGSLYSDEDLYDTPEIVFVEDARGDEDLLVDKAPDPWSDGMCAVEPKDCIAEQSDRDERPLDDQTMEESGEAQYAGDDSAMAPSEFRLPKSAAYSFVCDAITGPTPPLPCKAEVLSQEEIEKGAKSEHPVSARTSNDCLQVVPSPGLHARRNPLVLSP